jgi:hypothetical protein
MLEGMTTAKISLPVMRDKTSIETVCWAGKAVARIRRRATPCE